ncbi:MAG: phosphatase PAP2 family protein [Lachnospiraceae bacterium]|nr:phosphatase PAP2 family protein [Lachnospiraceae bacterium]
MNKKNCITMMVLYAVFVIFTVLVANINVMPIGPEGSSVGFAFVNGPFHELTGVNMSWYKISEVFGYAALLSCAVFGCIGLIQIIKKKSILKVDRDILCLGIFYVVVLAFYVLFEKVIINYRPVILEEGLEASYPSSHTMLTICTMSAAIMQTVRRVLNGRIKTLLVALCSLIMAGTFIGRLLSGVHWLTDIIGAILLSVALVYTYCSVLKSE